MQIRQQNGLATIDALLAGGTPLQDIERGLRQGNLREVSPGLLAGGGAYLAHLGAIADGWRPTCTSAAAAHGLWVPPTRDRILHAYRPRTARRSAPDRVVQHGWYETWPEQEAVATVPQLLQHAVRCQDPETCVVLVESAFDRRLLAPQDWRDIVQVAPVKKRPLLLRAAPTSQSGSETRVRFALESHRIPVEAQVQIPGVGRVDLCVKGIWIIECDSLQHHSDEAARYRDRYRDLLLQSLGYIVTRLTYEQIWHRWPETLDILLAIHHRIRRRVRIPLAF